MKIVLYLVDRMIEYTLPMQISGSYNFDPNENEESKLINIEARNNVWTLYSTEEVQVIDNGQVVNEIALKGDTYYYLIHLIFIVTTCIDTNGGCFDKSNLIWIKKLEKLLVI